MQKILEYTHVEANKFFLKEESYFNFDLPKYFVFEDLLYDISQEIEGRSLEEFYKNINQMYKKW